MLIIITKTGLKQNTEIPFSDYFSFSVTEEKIHKKLEDSLPPEVDLCPAAKDQVEM